jgi:hypothetical protein
VVLQKAIDKAKAQEPEDKKLIAGGIAAMVVVILVVAWGLLFLKKIQRGVQTVDLSAGAQDEFNFTSVREAQRAIQDSFQYTDEELRTVRDSAIERQLPAGVEGFETPGAPGPADQFGSYTE